MADISKDDLRKAIGAILKDADLTTMTVKKIRLQIEEEMEVDLTNRKKEVDELTMEYLRGQQEAASKESEDGEEDEDEAEGSEEEEEDLGFLVVKIDQTLKI